MFSKTNNTSRNPWGDDHPEKLIRSQPKTIGLSDQVKDLLTPDKMLSQIFGKNRVPESFYQSPEKNISVKSNETLVFSFNSRKEQQEVVKETQIILQKLKEQVILLEKSEKSLAVEVSKIKVEQLPQKTGIYYIRFLEWLITVVKQLRMKVEDGRTWLTTFTQRRKKRLGYWQMYKKHGTTFGLSHERTLATQTG